MIAPRFGVVNVETARGVSLAQAGPEATSEARRAQEATLQSYGTTVGLLATLAGIFLASAMGVLLTDFHQPWSLDYRQPFTDHERQLYGLTLVFLCMNVVVVIWAGVFGFRATNRALRTAILKQQTKFELPLSYPIVAALYQLLLGCWVITFYENMEVPAVVGIVTVVVWVLLVLTSATGRGRPDFRVFARVPWM